MCVVIFGIGKDEAQVGNNLANRLVLAVLEMGVAGLLVHGFGHKGGVVARVARVCMNLVM